MNRRLAALGVLALVGIGIAATFYFRAASTAPLFQGWIEADFVFVSPDEIGRIETLSVREGSEVKTGAVLFTLDDDLQRAAVAENEAYVANAEQDYTRAQELLKKAVGSAKTFDEAKAALRSAEVLGLNVCGVDLLRSNRGPVVIEVNSSPGIEGMEQASGADVAGAMIEFLEKRAKRGETQTRGKG